MQRLTPRHPLLSAAAALSLTAPWPAACAELRPTDVSRDSEGSEVKRFNQWGALIKTQFTF